MRTVRRLYVYAVAFISLEILLWGAVGVARSIICKGTAICGVAAILTQGLAAILVAIPFFGVHWWLAERSARREAEERASAVRAVFLYGTLLATFIPIVQSAMSLLDRLMLQAVGLSPARALFGPQQTWTDNLIAIGMNAVFAAYFLTVLRADWQAVQPATAFADIRRLYRFIWLTYGLGLTVAAVEQLLRFILSVSPPALDAAFKASGAHGVVLALLGVPLWYFTWRTIRLAWADPVERNSPLRLGMLYLYALAGVLTVLSSAGVVADVLLRRLLGESITLAAFMTRVSVPLSIGIPLGGVWAYYGHELALVLAEPPDPSQRSGRRRLYAYILSAIGLGATFTGLSLLLTFVVDAAIGQIVWADVLRPRLAAALATLLVALPLWGLAWRPMQAEALAGGDAGDHARRSLTRRVYLYLALFASVVGGMVLAVSLLNLLLRSLLGGTVDNLLQQVLKDLEMLGLCLGLGLYHGLRLRQDGQMAARALAEKHAVFPVLVIDSPEGAFGAAILEALHKQAPRLPVQVHPPGEPPAAGDTIKAVLLPSGLALDPPAPLRAWLDRYRGSRLVVPLGEAESIRSERSAWLVAGGARPLPQAAAQAALLVRQLAEGQEVRQVSSPSGWRIVAYVAAGFVGLELLAGLISLVASLLGR